MISQLVEIYVVIQIYCQMFYCVVFQVVICWEVFLYYVKGFVFGVYIKEVVVFYVQQVVYWYYCIFFGGYCQYIGIFVGFVGDLFDGLVFVFCFMLFDEIGVFSKVCGVYYYWNIVFFCDVVYCF